MGGKHKAGKIDQGSQSTVENCASCAGVNQNFTDNLVVETPMHHMETAVDAKTE
jgi:hypothetical protein